MESESSGSAGVGAAPVAGVSTFRRHGGGVLSCNGRVHREL